MVCVVPMLSESSASTDFAVAQYVAISIFEPAIHSSANTPTLLAPFARLHCLYVQMSARCRHQHFVVMHASQRQCDLSLWLAKTAAKHLRLAGNPLSVVLQTCVVFTWCTSWRARARRLALRLSLEVQFCLFGWVKTHEQSHVLAWTWVLLRTQQRSVFRGYYFVVW